MPLRTMSKKDMLIKVLLLLGVLALGLILFAVIFGDKLIFFPAPHPQGDWNAKDHLGIPIEEISFKSADGKNCSAWFARRENTRATFIVCHGNAGNITNRTHYLQSLAKLPASVLVFDYPGYGKSEGSPNEESCYQSAIAAWDWVVAQNIPASKIIVYGESLGGAVAVELAKRKSPAGLILQTTFTSISDMASTVIPFMPLGWAMRSKFPSVDTIAKLQTPKLIFHGVPDEVVPYRLGKKLFDASMSPKRWVEYPDLHHNEWPGLHEKDWLENISKFLTELGL